MERLFLAIDLSPEARSAATRAQADIRTQLRNSRVAWVLPEQFHITLHFLGNVEQDEREELVRQLDTEAYAGPFELTLTEVDAFPHKKRPQILWLGTTFHPNLASLRLRTANILAGFGFDIDQRPFNSHITLGRVEVSSEALKPEEIHVDPISFIVNRFQLMRSRQEEGKTVYETIASFSLGIV